MQNKEIRIRVVDRNAKEVVIEGSILTVAGFIAGYQSEGGDIGKFDFYLSTLMRDKNKVEIFTGDIVKKGNITFVIEQKPDPEAWGLDYWDFDSDWEVIGNIYSTLNYSI